MAKEIKNTGLTNYVIYNSLTGVIKRYGTTSSGLQTVDIPEGYVLLEGTGDYIHNKVVDGEIVDKTSQEMVRPSREITSIDDQQAFITNGQLNSILNRLNILEKR